MEDAEEEDGNVERDSGTRGNREGTTTWNEQVAGREQGRKGGIAQRMGGEKLHGLR